MPRTILKQRLAAGESAVGALQNVFSPAITEALARSGVDFILFDLEHTGYDTHQLDSCILTAYAYDIPALVRPREIDQSLIEQALESGAQGVVLPTVETVEHCRLIVRSTKYGPAGTRGFDPTVPASRWMNDYSMDTYLEAANRDIFVMIMIETPLGVKNLPYLLEIEGIDGVLFGAADLAVRMGKPLTGLTSSHAGDPEIPAIIASATELAVAAEKTVLAVAPPDRAGEAFRAGARMFLPPTMDTWVLTDYYKDAANRTRANLRI